MVLERDVGGGGLKSPPTDTFGAISDDLIPSSGDAFFWGGGPASLPALPAPPVFQWYVICPSVALLKMSDALIPKPASWPKSKFSLAMLRLLSRVLRISTFLVTTSSP